MNRRIPCRIAWTWVRGLPSRMGYVLQLCDPARLDRLTINALQGLYLGQSWPEVAASIKETNLRRAALGLPLLSAEVPPHE